jgi:phosphocarrier protein HPr
MAQQKITIINKLGLHTRASAKLVNIAGAFESKVELTYNNRTVNAKSIMGVITLGAIKDSIVEVVTSGLDEIAALAAVIELVNARFGEAE